MGYKLYIKEWFNPKYRTPSGSNGNNFKKINKDDINDINDINNILENKIFFETIPIKDEPENNYTKRRNNFHHFRFFQIFFQTKFLFFLNYY